MIHNVLEAKTFGEKSLPHSRQGEQTREKKKFQLTNEEAWLEEKLETWLCRILSIY